MARCGWRPHRMVSPIALGDPLLMTRRRITSSGRDASMRAWQAPAYVLATSLMVGAIMISAAPPGVGWGMFLIGCALIAARNASGTGPTRGAKGLARPTAARR